MSKRKEGRRASERNVHYTYCITDKTNGLLYYGVHSTDFDPSDINQYHSSSKILNHHIKAKGISNFTKKVRRVFDSRLEASVWESKVLRRLKVSINDNFYNQTAGGKDYCAVGYTVLKDKKGNHMRVPVGTDLSSEGWVNLNKGRPCPDHVKDKLSKLHKGKHLGEDNNVHKIRDKEKWRLSCAFGSEGVSSPTSGNPSPKYTPKSNDSMSRARLTQRVNPNTKRNVYLYKGCIYLYSTNSLVDTRSKDCILLEEKLPDVHTIVCKGNYYSSIKSAAKDLKLHTNTIANRIKSELHTDYYELPEDDILQDRFNKDMLLLRELYLKYLSS